MKKLIVIILLFVWVIPVSVAPVFAAEQPPAGIVEGGNQLCPVSGGPVSGSDFVIYQGKRYGLCCPACKGSFLSNPAKYIAQMIKQEATPASTVKVTPVVSGSKAMEKKMEQSGL